MYIGQFDVEEEVLVTDPCYDKGTWCTASANLPSGTYKCYVEKEKGIITSLYMIHKSMPRAFCLANIEPFAECGVDSGQLGIFLPNKYQKRVDKREFNKFLRRKFPYEDWKRPYDKDSTDKESFYKCCCNATLSTAQAGVISNVGCVCSSGYGDGCYNVHYLEDINHNLVGLIVYFT